MFHPSRSAAAAGKRGVSAPTPLSTLPVPAAIPAPPPSQVTDRRAFLWQAGVGLGGIALASLVDGERSPRARAAQGPTGAAHAAGLAPRDPHFAPRARRVIYLFMHGGPSHVDLFDPKPELVRYAGQPLPESVGPVMTRRKVAANPLLAPVRPFRPRGQSGLEISDFLPHLAQQADRLCVLRGCHGDSVNHPQSVYQMNTGSILTGRPSLGSWVSYGLGTENDSLPAFVVLPDPGGGVKGGPGAWGNGYLPASYQGTTLRPGRTPIVDLAPQPQISPAQQAGTLELARTLNADYAARRGPDSRLDARIEAYELAFRMQAAAPEAVDLADETAETLALYGLDEPATEEFGRRCLLARRLIERGVRFVQLYSGDTNGWDAHSDVDKNHGLYCRRTDKPAAGLLIDLARRGLLDDTLVIWGGEFGRMPMSEQGTGRDHNPWGYSVLLAGAGVRGGLAYGATDPFGLRASEDKVHVHDLHATILHLLGLDHEELTYLHNGRYERLTDVAGRVVREILA